MSKNIIFELFSSIAEYMYMDSRAKVNKFNSKFMQKLMKFFDNKKNWAGLTRQYRSLLQRQKKIHVQKY